MSARNTGGSTTRSQLSSASGEVEVTSRLKLFGGRDATRSFKVCLTAVDLDLAWVLTESSRFFPF